MFKLAIRDLVFDRWMSLCTAITVCAIIAPLLLLYSLRFGIVSTMQHSLVSDPYALRISFRTGAQLDEAFFKSIRDRDDVAFVIEQTRDISNSVVIFKDNRRISVNAEASGYGDPTLLMSKLDSNFQNDSVYVSASAATRLKLTQGDSLSVQISRLNEGITQIKRAVFKVRGIINSKYEKRDAIYLSLPVILAIEDYKSGYEPEIFSDGSKVAPVRHYYEKALIYGKDIYTLEALVSYLEAQGYDINSKVHEVVGLKNIKSTLDFIFTVIASCSSFCAFLVLIGFNTGAIKRRMKSIALMRLTGFSMGQIKTMIVYENLILGLCGMLLSLLLYLSGSFIFNQRFALQLGQDSVVSTLLAEHIAIAFVLCAAVSVFSALMCLSMLLGRFNVADKLREI